MDPFLVVVGMGVLMAFMVVMLTGGPDDDQFLAGILAGCIGLAAAVALVLDGLFGWGWF